MQYLGIDWSYRRAAWCAVTEAGGVVAEGAVPAETPQDVSLAATLRARPLPESPVSPAVDPLGALSVQAASSGAPTTAMVVHVAMARRLMVRVMRNGLQWSPAKR